jgi:hypothetical protein
VGNKVEGWILHRPSLYKANENGGGTFISIQFLIAGKRWTPYFSTEKKALDFAQSFHNAGVDMRRYYVAFSMGIHDDSDLLFDPDPLELLARAAGDLRPNEN